MKNRKKNFGQIGPEFCARFSQPVSSKILKVESVERLYQRFIQIKDKGQKGNIIQ